jgi:hypothetical protein
MKTKEESRVSTKVKDSGRHGKGHAFSGIESQEMGHPQWYLQKIRKIKKLNKKKEIKPPGICESGHRSMDIISSEEQSTSSKGKLNGQR